MSVRRVMGLETEYGILVDGQVMHPHVAATQVVTAYARQALPAELTRPRWDYGQEAPFRDARGFDASPPDTDPVILGDDAGMANAVLLNGARLYVDHAHPEYSTPEVTGPVDAARFDRAGMLIMAEAARILGAAGLDVRLYRNNTDGKGASYGTHENYLMDRRTPFESIVRHLTPFLVTRQVVTGSGRVGLGSTGGTPGFQLSQRADFFETEVGLETTFRRPIINTRDEPHADPERYRRLHVIVGDANLADVANLLKMGTTSLVLSMLEAGALDDLDAMPLDPVLEIRRVSHDPSLEHLLTLAGGRRMRALDLQREYCERAHDFVGAQADDETRLVLDRWASVLDRLAVDPMQCASELDWVAKLAVLEAYRQRDGLDWSAARLQAIDLQYADVREDRGIARTLERTGRLERLFDDGEVERAVVEPPTDTRAWFRGACLRRWPAAVAAASWDAIVLDIPGREALVRVMTLDPLRGTEDAVGEVVARATSAADLLDRLGALA